MQQIIAKNAPFERLEVSKENLLQLFSQTRFKVEMIEKHLKSDSATVYRCGNLVDICNGPHLMRTKGLREFKLLSVSSAAF